jgi:hypothetical protein
MTDSAVREPIVPPRRNLSARQNDGKTRKPSPSTSLDLEIEFREDLDHRWVKIFQLLDEMPRLARGEDESRNSTSASDSRPA